MRAATMAGTRKTGKKAVFLAVGVAFIGGLLAENRAHLLTGLMAGTPGVLAFLKGLLQKYLPLFGGVMILGTRGFSRAPTGGEPTGGLPEVRGP
ncbi:MAG: hypothetical protein IMW93_10370 [Thermoanaerobacteraceae bacterium]|nr:hypothetical protein [Thermoanaerobacteraceae bacterium]